METMKAIALRKSTRDFSDRQVPMEDVKKLLAAGCAAPIAHGEYKNLHLTVVRDPHVLEEIRETAVDCFRDPILDIYYGAPTVVIVSTSHGSVPELDMANAGIIIETMMLAATDLGIDSCYVWGTTLAFRAEPDLAEDIDLPEGQEVLSSVAFGYAKEPDRSEKPMDAKSLSISFVE